MSCYLFLGCIRKLGPGEIVLMAVVGTEVETGLAEGDAGNRAVLRARLQSRLRLAFFFQLRQLPFTFDHFAFQSPEFVRNAFPVHVAMPDQKRVVWSYCKRMRKTFPAGGVCVRN